MSDNPNRNKLTTLLERTRKRLFWNGVYSRSLTYLFYGYFGGTGVLLMDRIAGDLSGWTPVLTGPLLWMLILLTGVAAIGGAVALAWQWDRHTLREIAWALDRVHETNGRLLAGMDHGSDTGEAPDDDWHRRIRKEANRIAESMGGKNLVRRPTGGIRWFFVLALCIQLLFPLFVPSPAPSGPTAGNAAANPNPNSVVQTPSSEDEDKQNEPDSRGRVIGTGSNNPTPTKDDNRRKNDDESDKDDNDSKHNSNKASDEESDPSNSSDDSDQEQGNASSSGGTNNNDSPLYGEKERTPHEREKKSVEMNSEEGPRRPGRVRIYNPRRKGGSDSGKSTGDGGESDGGDEQSDAETEQDNNMIPSYRKLAEERIRMGEFSRNSQSLIRAYFRSIQHGDRTEADDE